MEIKSEQLAYWYLRLNGFLTILNFIVHPDRGNNQETDVDVLGVRFPYRAENLFRPMKDEARFNASSDKPLIAIAEVKRGRCALNGPWTKPERKNMSRVLAAIGAFERTELAYVAQALYKDGHFSSDLYQVSLLCFGEEQSPDVAQLYPRVPQILWSEVLPFVFRRFRDYRNQKISHPQWDQQGCDLWDTFEHSPDERQFCRNVRLV